MDSKQKVDFVKKNYKSLLQKYGLVAVAAVGIAGGVLFSFTYGSPSAPPPNQLTLPASSPYQFVVSGTGLVEANSENINISSPTSGIIESVHVTEGQLVKKGDPLFIIDTRTLKAELSLRTEEVAVLKAALEAARVNLKDLQDQQKRQEDLKSGVAVSIDRLQRSRFASEKAKAEVERAEAELKRAEATLELTRVNLEKLIVRAPIDGTILKVRTRVGEYVGEFKNAPSPVLMGNIHPLYLRVQIDENDIWRFRNDKRAKAFLKSNKDISFDLKFVQLDPYAQSKQQLSGDSREQVDTRVIEVVYEILGDTSNLYIGQQLDVFMEAEKSA